MFSFLASKLSVQSDRDIKPTLDLLLWLAPAYGVATIGAIAAFLVGMNLPGSDPAANFLSNAFGLWIFTIVYVMVPFIVCAFSDPMEIRQAIRTMTASLSSYLSPFLPRIVPLLEMAGSHTTAQFVLARLGSGRPSIRPEPSIPAFGFSPGTCPQLE